MSFRILNDTDKTPYLMQSSVELLDEGSGLDIKENNINIPLWSLLHFISWKLATLILGELCLLAIVIN